MKRRTPLITAMLTLVAALTAGAAPGQAAPQHLSHTPFAFSGSGYGSRVLGGQVPAGSDTTAYQAVGCTDRAGVDRTNDVADATVPGLGTLSGARTRVWTTQRRGITASHSSHRIVNLTLASSGLGSLSIDAITSRSTAYHDRSGFHTATSTTIGTITFTPPTGPEQTFPAPTPDQPLEIPGLASLHVGRHLSRHDAHGAKAEAVALRIDVIPTATSVGVAHTRAELHSGLTFGIFRGHSNATRVVHALDDLAHSGPNPLTLMPCQGTYGRVHRKALAHANIGGQLVVHGLSSQVSADQTARSAHGSERAAIARINLGKGQLVVDGIVGKATLRHTDAGLVRSTRGTRIGTITANGQRQVFPRTGVLEIPGLARLERRLVTKSASGVKVVALRVTLLDGSGAVIDLGEAQLQIRRLPH